MKAQHLIAAAIVAITAQHAAFAQDAAVAAPKTRAQVQAELQQARADGSYALLHDDHGGYLTQNFSSTKTREQVKAELAQARADGTLDRINNYQRHGLDLADVAASNRSRAEVRAEVLQAVGEGEHLSRGNRNEG